MEIGEIVSGKVTGIKPYGAFVALDDNMTGLIHISEISNGFVKDVSHFVKVDDVINVKVIDIDMNNKQCRLSIKALGDRRRQKRKIRYKPLETTIGFKTIADNMDRWIKEAKEEINND